MWRWIDQGIARMKLAFLKRDWVVGVVLALAIAPLASLDFGALPAMERAAYDLALRVAGKPADPRLAVIAIDDRSLQGLGRWPWSRDVWAKMIALLAHGGAKVIAPAVSFSDPQLDPGLLALRELKERFATIFEQAGLAGQPAAQEIGGLLAATETKLDGDRLLATAIAAAGTVVLPMQPRLGEARAANAGPGAVSGAGLLPFVARNALARVTSPDGAGKPPLVGGFSVPVAAVGEVAAGLGALYRTPDRDGVVRAEPLVVGVGSQYFPAFPLLVAARGLGLGGKDIAASPGELTLGQRAVPIDPLLRLRPYFYGEHRQQGGVDRPAFAEDPFIDVYSGKIPAEKYKGKTVLLGLAVAGLGEEFVNTPVQAGMSPLQLLAHTVASLMNQDAYARPVWGVWVGWAAFCLVLLYLIVFLPLVRTLPAVLCTLLFLSLLLGAEFSLLLAFGQWLALLAPCLLLVAGQVGIVVKRLLVPTGPAGVTATHPGARKGGAEKGGAESAFTSPDLEQGCVAQEAGDLDGSQAAIMRCPLDQEPVREALYNLGRAFERKHEFVKANIVYHHLATVMPEYRDIAIRVKHNQNMEDAAVALRASRAQTQAARRDPVILGDSSVTKPRLGSYELEKELGKGAMGVVYLGHDPKTQRTAAIKTMALSQEFEADELDEVKGRFFHEAAAAGRLHHPNIVSIYDVGEALDLAYIAMELLEGRDLADYIKKDKLLPVPVVMGVIFKSAMALDYAHAHKVVHRDIKPANIMYDPRNKSVKLTDFGIASITDSSKTKTGVVLGTPSFMSPEQLAGKPLDGRSDLFSLGVTFFQLLTGRLPFKGESMSKLLYKIANEPHLDLFEARPDLAQERPCLRDIINRALEKDFEARYQTGAEMARDIQSCAKPEKQGLEKPH